MIGVLRAVARSCLIWRASAKPSTSGIWQSVMHDVETAVGRRACRSAAMAARHRRPPSASCASSRASPRGCGGWSRCRPRPARAARRAPPAASGVDAAAVCGRSNTAVKWNVLPRPTSLSTHMRPPISSTSRERDGEAKPGAAVPPRRRAVGLGEGVEDLLLLLGRDADAGVDDAEVQRAMRGSPACSTSTSKHHFALARELDGVAEDVQQHLAEAAGIAERAHSGTSGWTSQASSRPFSAARSASSLRRIAHRFAQVELGLIEIEPPRLDLREVQDVVDDGQQRVRPTTSPWPGNPAARSRAWSAARAWSSRGWR